MTKLMLVRHGETEANVSQVWQGSLDAPLTKRGLLQVERLATALPNWPESTPSTTSTSRR